MGLKSDPQKYSYLIPRNAKKKKTLRAYFHRYEMSKAEIEKGQQGT